MTLKLTEQQLSGIIDEEATLALRENILFRGAAKLFGYQSIKQGFKKALKSLGPKQKSAAGGSSFGSMLAKKLPEEGMFVLIGAWMKRFFTISFKSVLLGIGYEFIAGGITRLRDAYDPEGIATSDMQQYSDVVEQKYNAFLTKLGDLIFIPEASGIIENMVEFIYVVFLKLRWKVAFDLISGAVPALDIVKYDPDVFGSFFSDMKQSISAERKELVIDVSDIVANNGPVLFDAAVSGAAGPFKRNTNYSSQNLYSMLESRINNTINEQLTRAKTQKIGYDARALRGAALAAMQDFVTSLNSYDDIVPDDYKNEKPTVAQNVAVPSKATPPVVAPTKEPTTTSKQVLTKKVSDTLAKNKVVSQSQRDAWVSWAEQTRKKNRGTDRRISEFLEEWFGYVRARILEENKTLFMEAKVYLPTKGEFDVKSFVSWLSKNNISLGRKKDFGLYDINWIEHLFGLVTQQAKQSKSYQNKRKRVTSKLVSLRGKMADLSDSLELEKDPTKRERIQNKINSLLSKIEKKSEKISTLKVQQKTAQGE